jgi:hypothetical protein
MRDKSNLEAHANDRKGLLSTVSVPHSGSVTMLIKNRVCLACLRTLVSEFGIRDRKKPAAITQIVTAPLRVAWVIDLSGCIPDERIASNAQKKAIERLT